MTAAPLSFDTYSRQELENIVRGTKCSLTNGLDFLEMLQNKVNILGEILSERIIESDINKAGPLGSLVQDIFDGMNSDFKLIVDFLKAGQNTGGKIGIPASHL